MKSLSVKHFDEIIGDLRYAKEFKTPLVLFTSNGVAIGLGEEMSFAKTEIGIQRDCFMKGYIIETKSLSGLLKEIDNQYELKFDFDPSFLEIKNPLNSIGLGMASSYTEYNVQSFLLEANSFTEVYHTTYKKDDPFMLEMKQLHADEGVVNLYVKDKYLIPIHKKILSYTASDTVSLSILDNDIPYYFARFDIENKKKGTIYNVYIKLLKV